MITWPNLIGHDDAESREAEVKHTRSKRLGPGSDLRLGFGCRGRWLRWSWLLQPLAPFTLLRDGPRRVELAVGIRRRQFDEPGPERWRLIPLGIELDPFGPHHFSDVLQIDSGFAFRWGRLSMDSGEKFLSGFDVTCAAGIDHGPDQVLCPRLTGLGINLRELTADLRDKVDLPGASLGLPRGLPERPFTNAMMDRLP